MDEYLNISKIDFKKTPPEILKNKPSILAKDAYDYLEALINLETSALQKDVISDEMLKQLMELNFFNKLIVYNLYKKSEQLCKKDSKRHLLNCYHAFSIENRDFERTELLKFVYTEMTLCLHQENPKSIEEIQEKRNSEIEKLQKRKEVLKSLTTRSRVQEKEVAYIYHKLKELKELTDEKIRKQNEIDKQECDLQQKMVEQVLEENNLKYDDFEELKIQGGKKFLIKKYPHARIYIQK